MCIIVGMIATGAVMSYASAKEKELEKRKHPKAVTDHVIYIIEEMSQS